MIVVHHGQIPRRLDPDFDGRRHGWLFGWLVGWLFGWLVGWLVGWSVSCVCVRLVVTIIAMAAEYYVVTTLFASSSPLSLSLSFMKNEINQNSKKP